MTVKPWNPRDPWPGVAFGSVDAPPTPAEVEASNKAAEEEKRRRRARALRQRNAPPAGRPAEGRRVLTRPFGRPGETNTLPGTALSGDEPSSGASSGTTLGRTRSR